MQVRLDEQTDAYKVMFDKLDWYEDMIAAFEQYIDSQIEQSRNNRHNAEKMQGQYSYEAALHCGMGNAYSDARVVLHDLLNGSLID